MHFFGILRFSESCTPAGLLGPLVAVFIFVERDVVTTVGCEHPDVNLKGQLLKKRGFAIKAHKPLQSKEGKQKESHGPDSALPKRVCRSVSFHSPALKNVPSVQSH